MVSETYENYLISLKDKFYKVLCLYEEDSETLDRYLYSLVYIELAGLEFWIQDHPHAIWYATTISKMDTLYRMYIDKTITHKVFKSELFGINRLIDKQYDVLMKRSDIDV